MHFTAAVLAIVAAVQPALAVVDFHMGGLVSGNFGTDARRDFVMLLDKKGGHACDNVTISAGHRHLMSPEGGVKGHGMWDCDDCSLGKNMKYRSPTNFQVNAEGLDTDSTYIIVRKNDGDWRVFDDSNHKLGECTELNGSTQNCCKGLDNYDVFRFMRCEGIARV